MNEPPPDPNRPAPLASATGPDAALRASETQYRRLFEAAKDGILMLDAESGEITAVNPFLADLLGYTTIEILGKKLWEISPFEDVTKSKILFKVLQSQEYIRYDDLPLETRRGRLIDVEFVSNIYVSGDRRVIQCNIRDITARRNAERARLASDERYHLLFNYAPDGILIADRDSRYLDANASMCQMLGYSHDQLVGLSAPDIVVASEVEHVKPALAALTASAAYQREWEFRRKDGSTFCADVMATAMPDGNLLAMIRDLTARKKIDDALVIAEERMRFALEAAHIGIWDLDYATGVLRWSTVMEEQYGLPHGTFSGTFETFVSRVHPDDRASVLEVIGAAATSGQDFTVQHRTVLPDGTVRAISGAGRIVRNKAGDPTRAIGISQDVTERNTLEAQFHQAQKMEAIGRLAGGVAHDFNNLLTVMLGFCEILLEGPRQTGPDRRDIEEIQKAALRAADLTKQLLTFSRKEIIELKILDVAAILVDMRPMLGRLIREDVRVVFGIRPHLAGVKGDRGQLEQVIVNLAVNAQDAMPNGGILTIEAANVDLDENYSAKHFNVAPGPYVVITVSDSGTGMTAAVRERLFEPFFTTKKPGQGTGLGLATVHGIVARSGGSVSVYSEPGRGTSFKVYLPRTAGVPHAAERPAPATGSLRGTEVVLVVEDADGLRDLTRRLLERLGYTVLVAANAAEAIRQFDENPSIQLILSDVVMPGLSGPGLIKQLVERRPGLKVIYMSGYTDEAIVQHGVLMPGIAFLHKPFTANTLATKLREALDQPMPNTLVTYQIDGRDRITSVSDSWAPFAIANDGASAATNVIGSPLWNFVSDATTQHVYRDLIARVRGGRTVAFSFRCDSPDLRRFMRMTMSPGPQGAVTFDSLVVRTEARVALAVTALADYRKTDLMRVCGWCKRVAVADEWLEVELAIDRLGLLAGPPPSGITHGMCPACFARVMAATEAA
jgi:two-component system cell cycle sensor histidine kinase/response regulator CckA